MIWNVNPILLSLGPLTIRWYGLLFVTGFMVGYYGLKKIFQRDGYNAEVLDSLLVHIMLGTIIGARLGHCFFYEPAYFFSHPLEIFTVWKGGLASHGGFFGVLVGTALFCRKYRIHFLYVLDRVAVFALFSGGLIRIGNLMNSEIIGRPTNLPWAFIFTRIDPLPRHPTQIYESLAYLTIAGTAWWFETKRRGKLPNGFLLGWILTFGFTARLLLEFLKENQEPFENGLILNMGQILSLIPILVGIVFLVAAIRNWKPAADRPGRGLQSKKMKGKKHAPEQVE